MFDLDACGAIRRAKPISHRVALLTTKTGSLFCHPRVLYSVIPAKAGIQSFAAIDSRLRGNDVVVIAGMTWW